MTRPSRWILLVAAIFLTGGTVSQRAEAAGFDCSRASTDVEHMICNDSAVSDLDSRMVALYQRVAPATPEVKDQQHWLKTTRNRCTDTACLANAYEQRIAVLEEKTTDAAQSITGKSTPHTSSRTDKHTSFGQSNELHKFYRLSEAARENLWSNPNGELFAKRVIDWSEKDFQTLEQSLYEQLDVERKEAMGRHVYSEQPGIMLENDPEYISRKELLETCIAGIPKYKKLLNQFRAEQESAVQEQNDLAAKQEQQTIADSQTSSNLSAPVNSDSGVKFSTMFYALIALGVGGWIWNIFIRRRCGQCKSTNIETIGFEEVDRWRGTKKVTEQNSRGTKTRHVSTTYVRNQYEYECQDCNYSWLVKRKQEL